MMPFPLELLVFVAAILCHEAGHIIGFALLGMRPPRIEFKGGFIMLDSPQLLGRPYWQAAYVGMYGVLTGAIYLMFTHADMAVWTAYLLACMLDINGLVAFFGAPTRAKVMPLIDYVHEYHAETTKRYYDWLKKG